MKYSNMKTATVYRYPKNKKDQVFRIVLERLTQDGREIVPAAHIAYSRDGEVLFEDYRHLDSATLEDVFEFIRIRGERMIVTGSLSKQYQGAKKMKAKAKESKPKKPTKKSGKKGC